MIRPANRPLDRIPPHSLESEMCLLASMMLDASCIPAVRAVVNHASFYLSDHQTVFDCVCALADRGSNIDAVLLREELLKRKMLDDIGGTAYLGSILQSVPSAAHAMNYAEKVRDKWVLRECLSTACEVQRRVWSATESGEHGGELASYARDRFADAAVTGCSDGFRLVGDIAMEVYDGVEKGRARFVSTGILSLDNITGGLQVGGTTMVGGRPGMGKSQMVKQILRNCATAHIPCGLVTVEEKGDKVAANCLAAVTGIRNSAIMHGTVAREMWADLSNGVSNLSKLPLYVNDRPVSLTDVVGAVTLAATKYKCPSRSRRLPPTYRRRFGRQCQPRSITHQSFAQKHIQAAGRGRCGGGATQPRRGGCRASPRTARPAGLGDTRAGRGLGAAAAP
jgi:replicative DNA helicase